ncbi:MAG: glycosyltransferase [Clostridia bacterium]
MFIYIMLISLLCFILVQLLIELGNVLIISRFPMTINVVDNPLISILVPARNEEANIKELMLSLLAQDYPNYEVIVLNDYSEDSTGEILADLAKNHPKLRVLSGTPLPIGWYGKHWACHQLAQEAKGAWILFTDADTVHQPSMLTSTLNLAHKLDSDLLTAFVQQKMLTFGEKLTVPFPIWSIFTLLPIFIGTIFHLPAFSAVNGQFMFFKKSSYNQIGGHESVRNHAADDISLGRLIIKHKLKLHIHDATALVECRMYHSFKEAYAGFTKNYFAIFNYRILLSIFVWSWIVFICWFPLIIAVSNIVAPFLTLRWSLICYLIIFLQALLWLIPTIKFKMPPIIIILHPLIILISSLIGYISMIKTIFFNTTWKGRNLKPPEIKFF